MQSINNFTAESLLAFKADAYARAVHEIKKKRGLNIYDEDGISAAVLEEAENESSPLHEYFEWDDSMAAQEYRKTQSRVLVRTVKLKIIKMESPVKTVETKITASSDRRITNTLPIPQRMTAPLASFDPDIRAERNITQTPVNTFGIYDPENKLALHNKVLVEAQELKRLITRALSEQIKPSGELRVILNTLRNAVEDILANPPQNN